MNAKAPTPGLIIVESLLDGPSMLADLERLGWSHGDLQHGNILVARDDTIRLLDYDGMFVPALAGKGKTEDGHRHYQHPERRNQKFGPSLDRFSGWAIALGVAAIAHEPALLQHNPDPMESRITRHMYESKEGAAGGYAIGGGGCGCN